MTDTALAHITSVQETVVVLLRGGEDKRLLGKAVPLYKR